MSSGGGRSTVNSIPIRKESNQSNGLDSTIRLSSFSVPRDLTLGGSGPLRGARGNANKKVYTPNLNVVRNKNTNVKTSKDTSFRGRNRPDRGKSERGGRGRGGRGALIQTAGLFSEGVGAEHIKRSTNSSYRSSGGSNEDTTIRKPTLIKREGKIDTKIEKQHIKEILGDTDEDDFDEIKTDLDKAPIKLSEERWNTPNVVKVEKIDPDDIKTKIDQLPNDVISEKLSYLNFKQQIGSIARYPLSVEEVFSRTQPQLFLLQLPDTLPCQTAITAPEASTNKEADDSDEQQFKGSSLRDLEEGQIGKLIRFKSGRQQLVLGSTRFDLGLGIDSGFLQEVMSITTNRDERSGNMVNLGPIQAKLTAVPDWESLFKDIS